MADLLLQLKDEESAKLSAVQIVHGPTIGDMYEGLSKSLLERAIPAGVGLQIVTGFIEDGVGGRSGQIDCMLVRGTGNPIPYTDSHLWHVADVLAVFEIKKTLYGADLRDAFSHLGQVRELESSYYQTLLADTTTRLPNATWASVRRAFAQVTGQAIHTFEDVLARPAEEQAIFHVLLPEATGAIRVAFGYDGFKTEANFRTSLQTALSERVGVKGYGPGSFPQLIVSGHYSLVKANGQPFTTPIRGRSGWAFFHSSDANPLVLMLELIWTRLARDYGFSSLWGDDLEQENLRPFLIAHPWVHDGKAIGWHLVYLPWEHVADASAPYVAWEPEVVTEEQVVVLTLLCRGREVRLDSPELVRLATTCGRSVEELVVGLQQTRLVARRGAELTLITEALAVVCLPDGCFVAAENNTGRLDRWLVALISGTIADGDGGASRTPA